MDTDVRRGGVLPRIRPGRALAQSRRPRKDKDDLYQHALREEWKRREEEESSRLLYVAMTRAEHHLVLSFSATGRKPANWAKLVVERLALDPGARRDELVDYQAPDGQPWKARVRIVAGSARIFSRARPAAASKRSPKQQVLASRRWTGQQDSNATVTALALFVSCPRKYYLSRYLGFVASPRKSEEAALISDEPADLSASEFGTQVHALLAGKPVARSGPRSPAPG